jgi:hypothetical protein
MDARATRARDIQAAIREILLRDWDPIGVNDVPEAQDEYDGYVGGVYRLLANGSSAHDVAHHLADVQREAMGLSADLPSLFAVANRLVDLNVRAE